MEESLAQLIYDYLKINKPFDENFINESIKIMIKYYQLEEFVLDIKPFHNKKAYARYNGINKTIYINYPLVNQYLHESIKINFPNSKEPFSYKYILLLHILLHEVIHAKQKQITECNDAESMILYEEFNAFEDIAKRIENGTTGIIKGFIQGAILRKTYMRLYEYSPSERLADIDSTKIISNIAKILEDEPTSLLMLWKHYDSHLNGYNIGIDISRSDEPTKYYLDSICSNEKWPDITKLSSNLTPIERIRLGLKVDQEELHKISNKSYKLLLTLEKHN